MPTAQPAQRPEVRLGELPVRGRVVCVGVIDAVTIQPATASPTYSAILTDRGPHAAAGGHRLRLLWLGRRRVPGIGVGTRIRVEGMVAPRDGLPTMFNPRYEIIGSQEKLS